MEIGDGKRVYLSMLTAALWLAWQPCNSARGGNELSCQDLRLAPGAFYPSYYYSRSYIQTFPMRPGQRALYLRLRPYEHYGENRPGYPTPGVANGWVQSDRFPNRYAYGFTPVTTPIPPWPDGCTPPPPGLYSHSKMQMDLQQRPTPGIDPVPPPPQPPSSQGQTSPQQRPTPQPPTPNPPTNSQARPSLTPPPAPQPIR